MNQVRPAGEVFLDARGNGRALRLTWHHEAQLVVLSLWRGDACAGTFRLALADVDSFVDALVDGLRGPSDVQLEADTLRSSGTEPDARVSIPSQSRREAGSSARPVPETTEMAAYLGSPIPRAAVAPELA